MASPKVITNNPPKHDQYKENCPYRRFKKWFRLKDTLSNKPLLSLVLSMFQELKVDPGISARIDGFLLLQHQGFFYSIPSFYARLFGRKVDSNRLWPEYNALLSDLNLLLGVLRNSEIFTSYGYKRLKGCGLIDKDLLDAFSQQTLDSNIDDLNDALRRGSGEWKTFTSASQRIRRKYVVSRILRCPLEWKFCQGKPDFRPETLEKLFEEPLMGTILIRSSLPQLLTNHTTSLRLLLDQGADASGALVIALAFGFEGVAGNLVGHSVDVNCITENGSPLSVAANTQHHLLAMYLVQHGADGGLAMRCLHLGNLGREDRVLAEDMLRKLLRTVLATKRISLK
ncbi:nacht and ankyrin domain protein [Colletotrichum incanum]|uniref:Nacht and ankyrin domain protein n=1 Tax=Colletotrichum incanum TaxID=1573173 RepID=A0A162NCM6_COLIC|nr:nacht and ankyrin domain protein [Colletotrichum incanum]